MLLKELLESCPELQEEADEYAGKMEYGALHTREEAERLTAKHLAKKYKLYKQGNLFSDYFV